MAYNITIWGSDGPSGECQIKSIRIKTIAEIPEIVTYWSSIPDCVLVLKERTSGGEGKTKQDEIIWQRPGYQSDATPPQ